MPTSSDLPYIQPEGAWRRIDRRHGPVPAVGSRVAYKSEGHLYAGTVIEYLPGDPMGFDQRRCIVRSDNPWHVRMLDHFTGDLWVPAGAFDDLTTAEIASMP